MKTKHWAYTYAEKVIRERGEKDLYVCASGITPSGTVHIGNFREVISVDLVARALKNMGRKVKFIYSWDNYDVFRKVPKNMPKGEILEKYLRFPIVKVPDTRGNEKSYARANEVEFEKYLPAVGILPIFIDQSQKYMNSDYAREMKLALDNRDKIREILNEFRSEKLTADWMPVSVFCTKCNKDTTKVKDYDNKYSIKYICDCGNSEELDLRESGSVKLPWRIDWPMRWKYEGVDFEPAGKDHHSSGGSFDTSKKIVEVFSASAPTTFQYDFISIKGRGGKISSSSGEVVSLKDVLEIYIPEIVRYLFASTKPNSEFAISFDLDVIKIYEDYDRAERIYYGIENVSQDKKDYVSVIYELSQVDSPNKHIPYQIGFRHLTVILQIFEGDIERVLNFLDIKDDEREKLKTKIICAKNWLNFYAPDDFKFSLKNGISLKLEENESAALESFLKFLESKKISEKEIQDEIYKIARANNIEPALFFKTIYMLLIGKERGPKLGNFIKIIGEQKVRELLKAKF